MQYSDVSGVTLFLLWCSFYIDVSLEVEGFTLDVVFCVNSEELNFSPASQNNV